LFEKQSDRQQQVADVTHPEQVPEFIDSPVVNALRQKENQREDTKQAEFCAGGKIHGTQLRIPANRKKHCDRFCARAPL
jgi:hypothetical protein